MGVGRGLVYEENILDSTRGRLGLSWLRLGDRGT